MTEIAEDDEPRQRLTLARLDARIALLERPRVKTWQERFVAQGAVIALVLSMATGGYTVWDNFVSKPRTRLDGKYLEVQKQLQQIAAINLSVGQQVAGARDRATANQIEAQGLAQKMPLLSMLLPEEPKIAERLKTPDYFILSNEVMATGDADRALDFADKALARAANPYQVAFAKRNRAFLNFRVGRLDLARAGFEDALAAAADPSIEYERTNTLVAWVGSELTNGDCARVPSLVARFKDAVARPTVYENTRAANTIVMRNLLLGQRRCPVDPAIVPADPTN